MNARVRLRVYWGVIFLGVIFAITVLANHFDNHKRFARNPYGNAPGGAGFQGGGFRHHQFMYAHHYQHVFNWMGFLLFLMIGLAVLFFFVKWLRKKAETSTMEQFIDPPLMSSHTPVVYHNATILDQWEKNLMIEKENE